MISREATESSLCVCVLIIHYEVRASHDTGEIVAGDQSGSHRVTLVCVCVCVCVLLIHYEVRASHDTGEIVAGDQSGSH